AAASWGEITVTAVQDMGKGIESAMQAALSGTESFGAAIKKAFFDMIAGMAEKKGLFYLADAIANVFFNPAEAAAEFATGAALMVVAGGREGVGGAGC